MLCLSSCIDWWSEVKFLKGRGGSFLGRTMNVVRYHHHQHHHHRQVAATTFQVRRSYGAGHGGLQRCCRVPIRASVGDQDIDGDANLQVSMSIQQAGAKGTPDLTKLFNDAQQNMMRMHKERLEAMEDLRKVESEKTILLARLAQLEAEKEASSGECELLRRKLQQLEVSLRVSGSQVRFAELRKRLKIGGQKDDPPSSWSDLLLRIDAMTLTGALKIEQASSLRELVRARDAQTGDVFARFVDMEDRDLAAVLLPLIDSSKRRSLHVVHICSEMAPLVQSGSVSSSITNLCRALRRKGHLVEIILPKYASLDLSVVDNLKDIRADLYVNFGGNWHKNRIWTGTVYGIAVTLIEAFHPAKFFDRDELYDCEDNFERFTYFCKVALEHMVKLRKQADIIHLHNWQTAAAAPMFWDLYVHQGLQNTRLLLTCHNFKYQCLQEPHKLGLSGLDSEQLNRPDRLKDDVEPHHINLLKGGVVYSNKVTTVSPIYASDLLIQEHGYGLHATLNNHKHKFVGIYNGLDEAVWDPVHDTALPATYSFEHLSGKSICKGILRQELGLPLVDESVPLVGCILFDKPDDNLELEVELIKAAQRCARGRAAQFVCVVHSKNDGFGEKLTDAKFGQDENVKILIAQDDALLHQVVAAADILLCPEVFEPTGQLTMIAMRYGAIPVARQVNSIMGSVTDVEDPQATGFSFSSVKATDVVVALAHALDYLKRNPELWTKLIKNCMTKDLSWDANCVEAYEAAYNSIVPL